MVMGELLEIVKRTWGYESLHPFQAEAMECVLRGRDSLVVLPTGGGKSLCFQAPALAREGMALVISPLIALMKDQVDTLRAMGVAAGCINSGMAMEERREIHQSVRAGKLKLLYVAPERVVLPEFIDYLANSRLSFVAIDEAHCISHWGHDFRPEYRALGKLREAFPSLAFHCYTATATPQVRADICESLGLKEPAVLVGSPDRPNLVYSADRRVDELAQVLEVLERHRGESGIIYCTTRKKVEKLCVQLRGQGFAALPYHAGMEDGARKKNQEIFSREGAEIIVATVAFGMGIDKPDVRYVIHTGMPKTIEHYQQESGRAGRDGLEAECALFYSYADFALWERFLGDMDEEMAAIARRKLNDLYAYCTGAVCRHKLLAAYFGEELEGENCGACDMCVESGGVEAESVTIAQKILSCVVRLGSFAGARYTAMVLTGANGGNISDKGHDRLSTWGLLREAEVRTVRDWTEQLAAQGFMVKRGEYGVLEPTERGWELLRGEATVRLRAPAAGRKRPKRGEAAASVEALAGGDAELFAALRVLRRDIATGRKAPAFTVFGDAALLDMVRRKPRTRAEFLEVQGVGERKCADYADLFLPVIRRHQNGAGE